jgi:hypothetical protein
MSRATWTFGFEDASEEVREPEVTTEMVEEREVLFFVAPPRFELGTL